MNSECKQFLTMLGMDLHNPYYTHAPYLYEVCKRITQNNKRAKVLELGMGNGSSPIFAHFSREGMVVDSVETDHTWYLQCVEKYYKGLENVNPVHHLDFKQKYAELNNKEYDLVFVDQGSWEDRNSSLIFLLHRTKCFIAHDYDYNQSHWPETHEMLRATFPEFTLYSELTPPTLVCEK